MVEKNVTIGPFEIMHDMHSFRVRRLVHIDAYIDLVAVE